MGSNPIPGTYDKTLNPTLMMNKLRLPAFDLKVIETQGKAYIFDPVRKKKIRLTPEEWVRQHVIHYLTHYLGYPAALIKVEASLSLPLSTHKRRSDIVVFDQQRGSPFMLIECKAAHERLKSSALRQLTQYNTIFHAPFLILTNGIEYLCYHVDTKSKGYTILPKIPHFHTLNSLPHHALS